jgi:hypothetical protein
MLRYVQATYILLHVKVVEGIIFCTREKDVTEHFVENFKLCSVLVFYLSEDP